MVRVVLPAHRVAVPVLERLAGGADGRVLGAGATAAWVDLGGFVLTIITREVPLLPNAVALTGGAGALAGQVAGGAARCVPGRVDLPGVSVTWDPADPPAWDPTVPSPTAGGAAVGRRGDAVLAALGVEAVADPAAVVRGLAGAGLASAAEAGGAGALELLLRGVLERDPGPAGLAAERLLGRGPGLTPEGDDLLAAVAATVAVLGPAAGLDAARRAALLAALVPADRLAGRTTSLAATLLELAARGQVAEPAGRLLDLGPAGERAWPAGLRRLQRLGHGSGRAYAAGIGAAASLLAAGGTVG
ncbi:MAG TPA: DUF2877 domain-containing protein [Actinomycetota bacterium]|nr:DUF2877 domain-containing protein [Actinomycetota bacterium]